MKKGFVSLVGAGPGDYKLISLKACEAIANADVIVYDHLADDRLLGHAKKDAELIYVGKQSKKHTMQQEDINQLLVDKAKTGKYVVRLKGGDPFVFGRGGEEALLLKENSIAFEIVPGITSAISVPAYAGIPVTQRNMAVSFAVVTGHENPDKQQSGVKWDKLATAVDTLVFLMGIEKLPHITQKLIENGRSADTPAAVIRWGTKAEQQTLVTTVGEAAADVLANNIRPPAIFIVGEVVTLRDKLSWFENRSLFGKNILVTRAKEQASNLVEKLEAKGAQCFEAPMIKVLPIEDNKPLDKTISVLPQYNWVIFTSANTVQIFFARMKEKGFDSRSFAQAKIVAVGLSTAAELEKYGLLADLVPEKFTAEGLIEMLSGKVKAGDKVLLPQAQKARAILADWLISLGAQADALPVYKTVPGEADGQMVSELLKSGKLDLITFTSSSTVTNLLDLLGSEDKELLKKVKLACIGPVTLQTCLDKGLKPAFVSKTYTIDALVEAIEDYFTKEKK